MSTPNKFPASNFPIRQPYMFPGMNPEKMGIPQPNMPRNNNMMPMMPGGNQPPGNNLPPNPYCFPRYLNPYMGGYNMMSMPPYAPYSPFGRQMPNPPQSQNQALASHQNKLQRKAEPILKQPKKTLEVIEVDGLQKQNTVKKNSQIILKPKQKDTEVIQKSKKTVANKNQIKESKQELKKNSSEIPQTKYIPYGVSKKKLKRQQQIVYQPVIERKTREKKPCIERIFIQIMKDKPQRDMVTKVGKQHQAIIPESYLNEYQYALKLKLQKKKSLMERMIQENETKPINNSVEVSH